jgi:DNA-directed RNA polymerase specialized sigma24 family protein
MTDEKLTEVLNLAIPQLPAKCRYTLLAVLEGQCYEDIAAKLKIDTPTVTRLYERAMEYLLEQVHKAKETRHGTKH